MDRRNRLLNATVAADTLTGVDLPSMTPEELEAYNLGHGNVPFRWEERFDICEVHAILHMPHHLTQGLFHPASAGMLAPNATDTCVCAYWCKMDMVGQEVGCDAGDGPMTCLRP